jgi:predicted ATPase/DNA-binding SARP family transcriptional activator
MSVTENTISVSIPELPVQLTRFVGREREIDELARLALTTRLLTLTGAGGSGKTRLAREVALRASESFHRVAWVDLAPLADARLLAEHVGIALYVQERAGPTAIQTLVATIGDAHTLLVLDNCEHMVEACAMLSESLLRACPRLIVLATSREALGIVSETAWLVPPLVSAEAVQLFVERAQAALPTFTLSETNSAAVAEICRRLDGIPLAIEFAAARVRVLSPDQIASRLGDAFRLLTAGSRTALPRHRTLRATMEWSYGLLAGREQVLLRRLGVFAGTFTLDAAEKVCAGEPLEVEDILDGVSALVDKSLVLMAPGDGEARYRLLETVRQYGAERLDETNEREPLERRFADYYLATMESAAPSLVGGSNQPGLVARLSADHDNIRAACGWSVADGSRAEIAFRFIGTLFWLWYATGQFREARQLTDRALALDAPELNPILRGRALLSSGLTALAQGEYDRSAREFDAALPLLRAASDSISVGTALAKWGAARLLQGNLRGANELLEEALAFTRDAPAHNIARIFARFWAGWAAYAEGDLTTARDLVASNLDAAREHGLPTTTGHSLAILAHIAVSANDLDEGCALVAESLEIQIAAKDEWGISVALDVVAVLASRRGRADDAARLLGGIDAHRQRVAIALPGMAPNDRERLVVQLRSTLGAAFDARYAEGLTLSKEGTIEVALAETSRATAERRVVPVSRAVPIETTRLRVQALGSLQVAVGGESIDPSAWGSARPRELLVYLLMHPEGRTKEQVGVVFWPDASAAQLRNSFHVALHRLRKALGGSDWVSLANERYVIPGERIESFDVTAFEGDVAEAKRAPSVSALEQAVARYHGDFLDGEPTADWHIEHRDRLRRLYVETLMALGAAQAAEDRHAKAADAYRRVLARDELHEEAVLALMRAHAAQGEGAQAVRVYDRFAARLRNEMEAKPRAETFAFCEQLRGGAPAAVSR